MSIFENTNKKLDEVLAKKKAQSFEADRSVLLNSVANDLARVLEPVFERTLRGIADKQVIKVEAPIVNVPTPKVNVNPPNVYVPEPKVTVNVPKTIIPDFPKIPQLEWPSGDMPIRGWVSLMGVDLNNPLPVQLRDENGAPLKLFDNLTQVVNNQAGGFKRVTIDKILGTDGTPYSSTNPIPVTVTSGGTATTGSNIVDSSGVAYSGSNPMPVYNVAITGAGNSTIAVGDLASDAADTGSSPVKIGGIARTANPTAVAAGDRVSATFDDLGRQVMRPLQVRDLIATAYVTLTSGSAFGTETTLLAATAGSMFDLIYVMGTNDSDVAAKVDIRGVTAGNVLMSLMIPGGGTTGIATPVPLRQTTSDTGNAWTVDAADITGTNLTISALFSREI